MYVISFDSHKPIYKQIEDLIEHNISTGKWPMHSKIKDEISLAKELGVSRGTLRKAIKSLIEKGLLTQIKSKGTFVVSNTIQQPLASRLISFSESMEERALLYKTVVLNKEIIKPDLKTAALLEISSDQKVTYIERVKIVDDLPIIYFRNYVPLSSCPDLIHEDLETYTIFSLLEDKFNKKIEWGRRYFKAVPALGEIAFHMSLSTGTPVIYLEQVVYSMENKPIEYSNVWINSDKFDIVSVLRR